MMRQTDTTICLEKLTGNTVMNNVHIKEESFKTESTK